MRWPYQAHSATLALEMRDIVQCHFERVTVPPRSPVTMCKELL